MKVFFLKNGTSQLILLPEDDMEKEFVKQLNGASVTSITDGNNILGQNVNGGLLVKAGKQN